MRPLDPALVRRAAPVRVLLAVSVALGITAAVATVVQAFVLGRTVATVAVNQTLPPHMWRDIVTVVLAVAVRAGCSWGTEVFARTTASTVTATLRAEVISAAARRGLRWRAGTAAVGLTPLLGKGLDGLHDYLGRYLPALVLASIVPLGMVVVLLVADPTAGIVVAVTLPLIPLFMALVGWYTDKASRALLDTVTRLAGYFADVVAGLPSLVVFGRVKVQARAVRQAAEQHRRATMKTLSIAFLSSMVLELLASLSVAIVAVTCGLRLANGSMTLDIALAVLLLAPEAYLPLRMVGARFHAAADGVEAVSAALEIIQAAPAGTGERRDIGQVPALALSGVTVRHSDGRAVSLDELTVPAGQITVWQGPSGCGKTTALALLAALDVPDTGSVTVDGIELAELDAQWWRGQLAWCGQQVALYAAPLRENIFADGPVLPELLAACQVSEFVDALPQALETRVGPGGQELSAGQRRRVALARALVRAQAGAPVILLDEPTEGLDAQTEVAVLTGIRPYLAGKTVVITTHRPAVLTLADQIVHLRGVGT